MVTRTGGSWVHKYTGLSTDAKPTQDANGKAIPNGSKYFEMDTKLVFIFDQENAQWRPWATSDSGEEN